MTKKVSKESKDVIQEKIIELKRIFPEIVLEKKVDFDRLQRTLGKEIDGREEKYSFNWAGRKEAFKNIQTTAKGTLIPTKDESIDFEKTKNLFIEGDNLEILKFLQKAYFNSIKMIYIDPPYNTGGDLIYKDNYRNNIQNYLEQTNQKNGGGIKLTTNPETNGRFHSDWITMMYSRLFIARNLLRSDGLIFMSIGEDEINNAIMIFNEIFGEENRLGIACRVSKKSNNKGTFYAPNFDYVVTYAKDIEQAIPFIGSINEKSYSEVETEGPRKGEKYQLLRLYMSNIRNENPEQRFFIECPDGSKIFPPGKTFPPKKPIYGDGIWRWTRKTFEANRDKIIIKRVKSSNLIDQNGKPAKWNVYTKTYLKDVIEKSSVKPNSLIEDHINQIGTHELRKLGVPFDNPKPSTLIKYLIDISKVDDGDIVLDFFAGSSSSAHAVLNKNFESNSKIKFIMVQLPESLGPDKPKQKPSYDFLKRINKPTNIAEISKERIRRVIEAIQKELKDNSKQKKLSDKKDEVLDLGFKVFKLDKSNYKIWEKYDGNDSGELKKQLELFKTPLISGYTDLNVIYECIIKEGYNLNSKIEKTDIKSNKVYKVTDGDLFFYISLDQEIKDKTIDELKLKKEEMFICLDEALNDSKKKNLSIQCNLKTI